MVVFAVIKKKQKKQCPDRISSYVNVCVFFFFFNCLGHHPIYCMLFFISFELNLTNECPGHISSKHVFGSLLTSKKTSVIVGQVRH